ncbi:MAG: hypothetical protein KDB22_18820 [Planctomycetales bacterium]|nr:hypothetical protein [Planctomycetales bacterium]
MNSANSAQSLPMAANFGGNSTPEVGRKASKEGLWYQNRSPTTPGSPAHTCGNSLAAARTRVATPPGHPNP